jgi:hypothetical protein
MKNLIIIFSFALCLIDSVTFAASESKSKEVVLKEPLHDYDVKKKVILTPVSKIAKVLSVWNSGFLFELGCSKTNRTIQSSGSDQLHPLSEWSNWNRPSNRSTRAR